MRSGGRRGRQALWAAILVASGGGSLAWGQQLWRDANGAAAGIGGSGTWNTTKANWTNGPSGVSPTQLWTNTGAATATFTGTPGTVTATGGINVASVVISTSGYRLTGELGLGSPSFGPGVISLASGVTATYSGKLQAMTPFRVTLLAGAGLLVLDGADTTVDSIRLLDAATLRINNSISLRNGDLDVRASSLANFGTFATASVGSMFIGVGGVVDLGSTAFTVQQTTALTSGISGTLTSTATGGLIVSRPPNPATAGVGFAFNALTSNGLGYLHVADAATVTMIGSTVRLVSALQEPAGRSSLQLGAGTHLLLQGNATVDVSGFPELHARTLLSVASGSKFNIVGSGSVLHIGSTGDGAGGIGVVEVSGTGSAVAADHQIILGRSIPVSNPGVGEL